MNTDSEDRWLGRVSHRWDDKVHLNLGRMQQGIVYQAFANGVEDSLLVSFFDQTGTLQFDMNMVEPRRAGHFLGSGAHANPFQGDL
jgi:hypothetical protein